MKQIKIYFGKQQESLFGGSYADVVTLDSVDDKRVKNMLDALCDNERKWFGVATSKGIKYINLTNVLWIDINDVEEKGDKNE